MRITYATAVSFLLMTWATPALGDTRFDVGLLLGSTHATNEAPARLFDHGTTYQATFGRELCQNGTAALSLEVPFIASPAFTTTNNVPTPPLEIENTSGFTSTGDPYVREFLTDGVLLPGQSIAATLVIRRPSHGPSRPIGSELVERSSPS